MPIPQKRIDNNIKLDYFLFYNINYNECLDIEMYTNL